MNASWKALSKKMINWIISFTPTFEISLPIQSNTTFKQHKDLLLMSFCQHSRKQGVYKLQMVENTLDIRTSDEITCIKIFIAEAYF